MANLQHLNRLTQDIELWNIWRLENPGEVPDLSNADLRNFKLSKANLLLANLSGAQLSGANLSDAFLSGAHLENSNLQDANLSGAHLLGSYLSHANLSGANLTKAIMNGCDCYKATLTKADLSQTKLALTSFICADLSEAIFHQAQLVGTKLRGSYLCNALLKTARLQDVDLEEAIVQCSRTLLPKGFSAYVNGWQPQTDSELPIAS